MNRSPTPDGLFVAYFVGECGVFADCLLCISLVGVVYLRIVRWVVSEKVCKPIFFLSLYLETLK